MDELAVENELLTHLNRLRARLRLRDGWLLAQRTLWLPALAALLLVVAGRIWPLDYARAWLAAPFGLWLLAVLGWSALRPLPTMRVARRVDRELELKERLSTSLALGQGADAASSSYEHLRRAVFEPHLVQRLHEDALSAARGIRPREDFPMAWLRRPLIAAAVTALLAVALVFLPNPMDAVIAERRAVEEAAQRQAEQIEELMEEVEQAAELTPEEREALLRQLEELARQLRENTGDREQALAELARAEQALRERLQPDAAAREAALAALAERLQQMSQSQRSPQDLAGAAEDLEQLAEELAQMTAEEREALAQELAQLAGRAGQAGESALAQALAEMAQAVEAGEQAEAQDAASRAADAVRDAQRAQAGQRALQRALAQMQSSRGALSQAGRQMAGLPGQGPGQGQNPGQGPGQGASQRQGQGQNPGSGAGSNANQLPPNQGGNVNVNPPTGEKPGQAGADLAQQVYAPQSAEGSSQNEVFIPGQETGQGTTEEREVENPLPGAPNPALVPYRQVLQQYSDAANQALDQSYIPSALKDYVKAYFLGLEE
mgnify:FL=1